MTIHFITLISEKIIMTEIVYRVFVKTKTKNHCRTRIKVHYEETRHTNNVPPYDVKDEFSAPELHLSHQDHQLIPGNFSYTYHKTPSFFQGKETGTIKNQPIANVLKQPPTRPEPTQTEGLDETIIREMEEKHNLRKDPGKTRNLDNIIKTLYHRLEDFPNKEAVNTSSTTPTQDDTRIPVVCLLI